MNRTYGLRLLGIGISLALVAATPAFAAGDGCDKADAKYRGNVQWCEQALAKCIRGVEDDLAQQGKKADAEATPQGQACNRAYDSCAGQSDNNRRKTRALQGCPD